MIRLVIIEDVDEVRQGLKYLLGLDSELEIIKSYGSAEPFLNSFPLLTVPNIILMDIGLPGINGIEATKIIKKEYPDIDILMLTIFEEEDKILNAIQAGATGYVLKNTDPGELVSQIKSIFSGGSPISPNIARKILTEFRKDRSHNERKNYNLTPREKEIFKSIADGLTYKEISSLHNIASSTVKKHILHIYQKLEVNSKVEFIKKVMEEDLI
ncbi:MAG: response regulator transcription factor [Spirochaetales bacterium]|nr:response regulator transcription factor [Spirochaetales bacterium]